VLFKHEITFPGFKKGGKKKTGTDTTKKETTAKNHEVFPFTGVVHTHHSIHRKSLKQEGERRGEVMVVYWNIRKREIVCVALEEKRGGGCGGRRKKRSVPLRNKKGKSVVVKEKNGRAPIDDPK